MNRTQVYAAPNPLLLQALVRLSRGLRRVDAAFQQRAKRRADVAAVKADAAPPALLGVWGASQAAAPGAALATAPPSFASRVGSTIWRALEHTGARRARGELLGLARRHEASRPEFAAHLRQAARRGRQ